MLSVRMTQARVFINRQTAAFAREVMVNVMLGAFSHDHADMIQPFILQAHVLSRYGPPLDSNPLSMVYTSVVIRTPNDTR